MNKESKIIILKSTVSKEKKDRLASALKLNIQRRKKIVKREINNK